MRVVCRSPHAGQVRIVREAFDQHGEGCMWNAQERSASHDTCTTLQVTLVELVRTAPSCASLVKCQYLRRTTLHGGYTRFEPVIAQHWPSATQMLESVLEKLSVRFAG